MTKKTRTSFAYNFHGEQELGVRMYSIMPKWKTFLAYTLLILHTILMESDENKDQESDKDSTDGTCEGCNRFTQLDKLSRLCIECQYEENDLGELDM